MKIGIMGAMPEEIDSIHQHMTNVSIIKDGGRIYHVGNIGEEEKPMRLWMKNQKLWP